MSRLIDADALIECLQTWKTVAVSEGLPINERFATAMIAQVNLMPTIEPERKKGRWIERNPQNSDKCRLIECDKCGFSHIVGFNVPYEHWIENRNFCERCGADMRGEQDE